jgi:hypothetical protein
MAIDYNYIDYSKRPGEVKLAFTLSLVSLIIWPLALISLIMGIAGGLRLLKTGQKGRGMTFVTIFLSLIPILGVTGALIGHQYNEQKLAGLNQRQTEVCDRVMKSEFMFEGNDRAAGAEQYLAATGIPFKVVEYKNLKSLPESRKDFKGIILLTDQNIVQNCLAGPA